MRRETTTTTKMTRGTKSRFFPTTTKSTKTTAEGGGGGRRRVAGRLASSSLLLPPTLYQELHTLAQFPPEKKSNFSAPRLPSPSSSREGFNSSAKGNNLSLREEGKGRKEGEALRAIFLLPFHLLSRREEEGEERKRAGN